MQKNELLHVSILFTLIVFTFVGIILGIVSYSRSNKYFLESDGEIVYCGSTIWMKLHGRDTSQENIELICKYNPPPPRF